MKLIFTEPYDPSKIYFSNVNLFLKGKKVHSCVCVLSQDIEVMKHRIKYRKQYDKIVCDISKSIKVWDR